MGQPVPPFRLRPGPDAVIMAGLDGANWGLEGL
jgi:hypothetical protein